MDERQTIYIINQWYGQLREHLKKDLAEFLGNYNFSIKIITGTNGQKLPTFEESRNIEILRVYNPDMRGNICKRVMSYLLFSLGIFFHLIKAESGALVIVTSQPFTAPFIVSFLKNIKKFSVIYNVQDLYPDIIKATNFWKHKSFLYKTIYKLQKRALAKADKIIVISQVMKNYIENTYYISNKKIDVIENWGNPYVEEHAKSMDITQISRPEESSLKISYVGNLGLSHEIDTLVGTFHLIKKNGISDKVKFIIIGSGENFRNLKIICNRNNFDFIEFKPPISYDELVYYHFNTNIELVISHEKLVGILVPSKFYTASIGKPVIFIGSEKDIPSEHIHRGKYGYFIQNGDSLGLFEIITNVLNDKSLLKQLSNNAYEYYFSNLSKEIRLKEWYDLITKMLEGGKI